MKNKRLVQIVFPWMLILGLTACAAKNAYKLGNEQADRGNWDAAVVHYMRAAREEPNNIAYRIALQRAIVEAANEHVKQANKHLAAQVLALGPGVLLDLRRRQPRSRRRAQRGRCLVHRRARRPGSRDAPRLRPTPNRGHAVAGPIAEALREPGDIRIQPKDESREFIKDWAPGSGVEDYVVSAVIEATK